MLHLPMTHAWVAATAVCVDAPSRVVWHSVFHVVMCGEACCTLTWACCCTLAWACVLAAGQRISVWLGETWLYTVASNQASTPVFSLRYF